MQLTLTSVQFDQGTSKAGKPYSKITITCQEKAGKITGFLQARDYDPRWKWTKGMRVEWELQQNGNYTNLANAKKADGTLEVQKQLDNIYKCLEDMGLRQDKADARLDNHAKVIDHLKEVVNSLEAEKLSEEIDDLKDNPL